MSQVVVNSRIPAIIRQAQAATDRAVQNVAEDVAQRASSRAPRGATGTLAQSIQAERVGQGEYAVTAEWYWRFLEFGTRHAGAQPFMVPAAQGHTSRLAGLIGRAYE